MAEKIRQYIHSLMTDEAAGIFAGLPRFVLFLLSLLYLAGLEVVFVLYKRGLLPVARIDASVISIGNLTVGGTGKTPLAEMVSRHLLERKKKVAILTRGYMLKAPHRGPHGRSRPHLFEEIGDEAALLHRNLPAADIMVGPDRVRNAGLAVSRNGADVLILDDGFQHWKLSRDIDILAIDATNPFGNGCLLPRGILREPVSGAVRANIIVLTKTDAASPQEIADIKKRLSVLNPHALVVSSMHRPVKVLGFFGPEAGPDVLRGAELAVVCGIGDPGYFMKTLNGLGAVIKASFVFCDHHPYDLADLTRIHESCRKAAVKKVITTEKDMIRLKPVLEDHRQVFGSFQLEFSALRIELEITENRDKFFGCLPSK